MCPVRLGFTRGRRLPDVELSLAEHVCLALVDEGVTHGWQIGTLLSADGEIGRVWTLTRPLTYRALELLTDKRLVRRSPAAPGARRERQQLRLTAVVGALVDDWLEHPRRAPARRAHRAAAEARAARAPRARRRAAAARPAARFDDASPTLTSRGEPSRPRRAVAARERARSAASSTWRCSRPVTRSPTGRWCASARATSCARRSWRSPTAR